MSNKKEIVEQSKLAFEFVQKLYLEVSYLIKEIEGLLSEEEERFIIGKPGGYGITARSSTGLEPNYVNRWLLRKLSVFFVPESMTESKGQTITKIDNKLKVFYLRILLNDKKIDEPIIYSGILYDIKITETGRKWISKFENLMGHFEYNDYKIFKGIKSNNFEDVNISFKSKLIENNLFDIKDSEAIYKRIIKPSLSVFRKV